MILQVYLAVQGDFISRIGARDPLAVRIVAEILMVEVFFKIAATRKSLQAIRHDEILVPKAKDILGGYIFDKKRI